MTFDFWKMHGAANDFVVIDHRERFLPDDPAPLVRALCDRRRGVGADGVLALERHAELDFTMVYWNADGSRAEFCGNGARCMARLALDLGLGRDGVVRFASDAGPKEGHRAPGAAEVVLRFGHVAAPGGAELVEAEGRTFTGWSVRAGVPHFVVPVDRVREVPLYSWGGALRRHEHFGAAGTNVDFIEVLASGHVAMRTFERGVEGETLACGSGAIASALAAALGGMRSPVTVRTEGGDDLVVSFEAREGGYDVTLGGPAEVAFRGTWTTAVPGA
jgi:diaminopimelate epimerase